jgi:hypothetical protein
MNSPEHRDRGFLRDWFAGLIAQAICTGKTLASLDCEEDRSRIAKIAYKMADSMLKGRNARIRS